MSGEMKGFQATKQSAKQKKNQTSRNQMTNKLLLPRHPAPQLNQNAGNHPGISSSYLKIFQTAGSQP